MSSLMGDSLPRFEPYKVLVSECLLVLNKKLKRIQTGIRQFALKTPKYHEESIRNKSL